jgi:short-subunit dehydrogenase
MLAANEGSIITVASLLAFSAGSMEPQPPRRTLYVAAKAATLAFTRTLSNELADTAIGVQVVCPGVVSSEWNSSSGRHIPWAMSPDDVVTASLTGLRLGESVCVPGLQDQDAALDGLLAAEMGFLSGGSRPNLADRYTSAPA